MPIAVTYPHDPVTAVPLPMNAQQIWAVARTVRNQMIEDTLTRRLEAPVLMEAAEDFCINEISFSVCWDFDHDVRNAAGKQVMGATEFDPASPDSIMVSINGPVLGEGTGLLLSTAAHEFGHVIFDGPGWIETANMRQSAGFADQPVASPDHKTQAGTDWREFRANEFMGALLTPAALLRVDLQRFAKRHRFPQSQIPSRILRGAPAYDGWSVEPTAADDLLTFLAERYGVSMSFIRVRLDRYDLLRTRWQTIF